MVYEIRPWELIIEPIRPTGVCLLCRIAEFIEHRGDLDAESSDASAGNHGALPSFSGAGEDNFVRNAVFHLPDVAGMRFRDLHHEEGNLVFVLVVKLVEGRNLPPERWSSVAAKDQHNGAALCR